MYIMDPGISTNVDVIQGRGMGIPWLCLDWWHCRIRTGGILGLGLVVF